MKMLSNCNYNKTKLVHELSKIIGFIDRHGIEDAKKENDRGCAEELKGLKNNLENHLKNLSKGMETIVKEAESA